MSSIEPGGGILKNNHLDYNHGGTLTSRATLRDLDLDRRSLLRDERYGTTSSYMSEHQTGTVFIRVSVAELKVQKCLQFELDETVSEAKQRILSMFSKELRDPLNYGLYMPPMNGRAGKFLDEERLLREYPLHGPIGFLEFKYKRRVYKLIHLNARKLKQLHNKTTFRQFMEHIKNGNLSKIQKLTNKGLDPNFHDTTSGETPLTLAVSLTKEKSREVIISLVSGGAHLDFRTKQGQTPVHKAVLNGNQTAVKTLLDLGASTNYKDGRGLTPLYYSILYGKNAVVTEMLLHERAIIGMQDEQGQYEIHQACRLGLSQHLEHLMFYGADLDVQNASGNTGLHICAVNNNEQCARILLFRGANKNIPNYNNQTPQQVAIFAGNVNLAEMMKDFDDKDVVLFREMPKFSSRRSQIYSSTLSLLSRSRSDPKLNISCAIDNSNVTSLPASMRSVPKGFQMNSDSGSYSRDSDSLRSMSISSESSGNAHFLSSPYHMQASGHQDETQASVDPDHFPGQVLVPCLNDRMFVCVEAYHPEHAAGLHMDWGDVVQVLSVTDTEFWEGSANDRHGWFPAHHVQEVRLRHKAQSMEDLLSDSRGSTLNRNTLAALIKHDYSTPAPGDIQRSPAPEDVESSRLSGDVLHYTGDDNSEAVLYNNSQYDPGYTGGNGVTRHSRRDIATVAGVPRPDATSTPRPDRRRASPSPSHHRHVGSHNSSRASTPNGSITSVESVGSGRTGRYQKRSKSAPPENNRKSLRDTDFILQNWDHVERIPGITRDVTYETVQDGVSIQRENWTSANIGVSRSGVNHTIYRSNSVNSGTSINTNTSLNSNYTRHTGISGTSSSTELEFTDVCNYNTSYSKGRGIESVDRLYYNRGDTFIQGGGEYHPNNVNNHVDLDTQSLHSGHGIKSSQSQTDVTGNYKFIRSYSDINLTSYTMDENRNMAQLSVPKTYMANGMPQTGIVIYKQGERILVNDSHNQSLYSQPGFLSVGRKQGTLMQSKAKFSSMPSLADSKGDKKLMKLLKKQEKEEKKRKEKEEKKRAKEEKKRLKLEKKLKTKTLPRNFQYQQNGSISSAPSLRDRVFRRPMLTLSAVPIDFEDGPQGQETRGKTPAPKMAPPPPPMPSPSRQTMSLYSSAPDLLRLEQVYGATLRGVPKEYSIPLTTTIDYGPRTVVLQRASAGYGFVLRGAKSQLKPSGELDFRPTPEFPALQYLDSVDPGSVSDKAGLKAGDFILEINGENVVRASHDRVVHLIRGTGDTLAMKVVTVKPGHRNTDWFQHPDKSMTMPNRKKKAAPLPPQRHPRTSLSMSKSEGQSISEELAVMETLDQAIRERKNSEETNKTASIRSRTAAKRVSCVELDNIGVTSNLERSKSTPDLLDGNKNKSHVYAVPNVTAPGSPTKMSTRPKGAPPAPPSEGNSPKKQAPKPPPQTEVITIDTSKQSPYASTKIYTKKDEKSDTLRQSTFRPVSDDSGSEKSFSSSTGHRHTSSNGSNVVTQRTDDQTDKPGVSFAEDKVFDSAATFLRKHPNAKLLITANQQPKLRNTNSLLFEPEPDYDDVEDDKRTSSPARKADSRQSVTVISVGDQQESSSSQSRYRIVSTIPTEDKTSHVIPPRPSGRAPSPPRQVKKAAAPPPPPPTNQIQVDVEVVPALPDTPPPDFDKSPSPRESGEMVITGAELASVPVVPQAPPPPPPPPPVPSMTELEKTKTDLKPEITPIPFTDIAAAVAKRQERIDKEGLKFAPKPTKQSDKGPQQTALETNQAAILAAVERRRKQLEQKSESSVVDEIESRLQKTKKLQAAKFNIAGSKVVKKAEDKPNTTQVKETNVKSIVNKTGIVKPQTKTVKDENTSKPKELSFTVKPSTSTKQTGVTEIKTNIVNTKQETKQVNGVGDKQSDSVKPQTVNNKDETKTNDNKTSNGQSDFLALAEKKRQEYLSRKSKTPPGSKPTTPRNSTSTTPDREVFRTKTIEIKPAEKKQGSPPISVKPKLIKGATTTQSYTEYQSSKGPVKVRPISTMNGDTNKNGDQSNYANVPPPPAEFRDGKHVQNTVVQLEIIPPPPNFTLEAGLQDSSTNQHSPAFSPDTASVVSSLSTLSSLSGDQDGRGNYDDLIAPPPPGFDDGESVVIPPPPEFGNENKNNKNLGKSFSDKPVDSWLCNDVLDWLDSLSMNQYKSSFQQNCIDGKKLMGLTRNNYIDLGVTQVGHRMSMERSIKKAAIKQQNSNIIASEHL